MSVSCDPGNYAKKKIFSKSIWKDGVYQLQCRGKFYTCLIMTLATQDQAEKRETTSRAIGGPVSGLGTRPRQL